MRDKNSDSHTSFPEIYQYDVQSTLYHNPTDEAINLANIANFRTLSILSGYQKSIQVPRENLQVKNHLSGSEAYKRQQKQLKRGRTNQTKLKFDRQEYQSSANCTCT